MKDSIIILCGGGPAPGMNTVVFSVAKTFLSNGYRVIGLHEGYTGLFRKEARTEDIDFFKADAYFNRGGSYLQMSRFKPTNEDFEQNFNLALFQNNNVKLLVTVTTQPPQPTGSPSSLRPRTIRSTTSTSLRRSMTTFHCLTTHRPSDSTPRRTRVRTSPAPFTRMPAHQATGFSSQRWDAAQVTLPSESARPHTAL